MPINFQPNVAGSMLENIGKGLATGGGIIAGGYGLNEFRKWLMKKLKIEPKVFEDDEEETGFYIQKESQDNSFFGPMAWGSSAVLGAYGMKKIINYLKEKEEQYVNRAIIDEINKKQKNIIAESLQKESQDKEISNLLDTYIEKQAAIPLLLGLGNLLGVAALGTGGYLAYDAFKDSTTGDTLLRSLGQLYNKFPEIYGSTLGALGTATAIGGYHAMNYALGSKKINDYLNVPDIEYRLMSEEEKKKFKNRLNNPEPINKQSSKKKVAQSQPNEGIDEFWDRQRKEVFFPTDASGNRVPGDTKKQLNVLMNFQKYKPHQLAGASVNELQSKLFSNVPQDIQDEYRGGKWTPWDTDLINVAQRDYADVNYGKSHGYFYNLFFKEPMEELDAKKEQSVKELNEMISQAPQNMMKGFADAKNLAALGAVGGVFNAAPMAANAFGQYNMIQAQKRTNKLMEEQNEMLRKGQPKTMMELSRMKHNG